MVSWGKGNNLVHEMTVVRQTISRKTGSLIFPSRRRPESYKTELHCSGNTRASPHIGWSPSSLLRIQGLSLRVLLPLSKSPPNLGVRDIQLIYNQVPFSLPLFPSPIFLSFRSSRPGPYQRITLHSFFINDVIITSKKWKYLPSLFMFISSIFLLCPKFLTF